MQPILCCVRDISFDWLRKLFDIWFESSQILVKSRPVYRPSSYILLPLLEQLRNPFFPFLAGEHENLDSNIKIVDPSFMTGNLTSSVANDLTTPNHVTEMTHTLKFCRRGRHLCHSRCGNGGKCVWWDDVIVFGSRRFCWQGAWDGRLVLTQVQKTCATAKRQSLPWQRGILTAGLTNL